MSLRLVLRNLIVVCPLLFSSVTSSATVDWQSIYQRFANSKERHHIVDELKEFMDYSGPDFRIAILDGPAKTSSDLISALKDHSSQRTLVELPYDRTLLYSLAIGDEVMAASGEHQNWKTANIAVITVEPDDRWLNVNALLEQVDQFNTQFLTRDGKDMSLKVIVRVSKPIGINQ
jgi:hypothetical protein